MAGYTRQSVANIVNGSKITAPPLNAEFNKIQDAFNLTSGHTHDGTTGNSQPIPLPTSVVGYLPVVNGGVGGKNNTTATADPTTADDATQGYAPGSIWINATTGYTHMCLYNTENAANWITIAAISNTNIVAPKATNTVDLGTSTFQFKDIHIDGTGYIDAVLGETVSTTGDVTVGGALTVTGLSTIGDITTPNIDIDGGSIDGTPIGAGTASTGAFAGLTATGNVTFAGATVASLGTVTSADIDGGSIDAVTLGTNSPVTEAQIDNINIDGSAITSTNANGNIDITPDGTGTVNITKAKVTGGSIDGTTVGATTASTGAFTTLEASTSITGDLTGDVTGDLTGDVYASNTTSKVLESGTDGTDATFTGNVTGNLSGDVTSTGTSSFATLTVGTALSFDAGATATISNLVTPTNSGDAANKDYVDTAVSNLLDSAPGTLDTLNELAAALGDDASFSTTMTNSLATKLPLAGGVMTGDINMTDSTNTLHSIVGLANPTNAQDAVTKVYADTKLSISGGSMTGGLNMTGARIINVGTPSVVGDVANKGYVDDTLNYGIAASTSASAANISASAAAGSATSASQNAATVTSLYDSFDDRYLGAKSSVPNSDNDGDALLVGALYFDTTSNAMKVYTGTGGWVETGSTVNGILDKFRYVSTASQTTFSGSDANGNTLAYDPSAVDVYLSGLRLVSGTDYTATSGTSIQLTTAPDTGSTLEIVAFGNVVVNDPQQITASQLDLKAIAESKALTAVDVFVYDTSKDSDGGAWRNRTQGTSWYNETLNTSTRGSRKEFPAVAVIVAEANEVTIYDGDDPDLPMWMEINAPSNMSAVAAMNGDLFVARSGAQYRYNFPADQISRHWVNATYTGIFSNNIEGRNDAGVGGTGGTAFIVSADVNDVAMTVLPHAPIDAETGLPVPTIAVATDGGVSVIKDDGTVVDLTDSITPYVTYVSFTDGGRLFFVADSTNLGKWMQLVDIPTTDTAYVYNTLPNNIYTSYDLGVTSSRLSITPEPGQYRTNALVSTSEGIAVSNTGGGFGQGTLNNTGYNTVNYITSSYNTGWMPGDIKLATLMDTTAETIVAPELVTNSDFSALLGSNQPELVTNGTFNTDLSGWSGSGSSWSSSNGGCAVARPLTGTGGISQLISVTPNNQYKISFDIVSTPTNSQGRFDIREVSLVQTTSNLGVGTHTFYYTPLSEDEIRIYIMPQQSASATPHPYILVDNVSVELVDDVPYWSAGSNTSLSLDSGRVKVENVSSGSATTNQSIGTLTEGKTYQVTADIEFGNGFTAAVKVGPTGGSFPELIHTTRTSNPSTGTYTASFTATTTADHTIQLYHSTSSGGYHVYFDNISVKEAVADRTVNDNGLNIVGNVTKSAVATGAELVGYSGWADNNHILQSPNSDLEFGTGDFCVMAWVKMAADSTSNGRILHIENTDGTNEYSLGFDSYHPSGTTGVRIYTFGADTNPFILTSTDAINSGNWTHVVGLRRNGIIHLYVNGKHSGSAPCADQIGGSGDDYHASVGVDASSQGAGFDGSLALVRASATAPTSEQIAKIYRDEKPLFQEGAKATLYGSSDNVTALSYDEDTDLLHAGTSAGRSVFKGLQRIDNTTDAVGSAISAVNGLVAED